MSPLASSASTDALRRGWDELKRGEPGIRIRDAADRLGVSEAELLVTGLGDTVRRITSDIATILPRLEGLGEVMALTRNHVMVHEKDGVYRNVSVGAHVAQVADHDIDLRIFPAHWRHGYAARVPFGRQELRSLQFFDAHGVAVHKVYSRPGTDMAAWDALEDELARLAESEEAAPFEAPAEAAPDRSDDEVDVAALEEGWRGMNDTHDFFQLLRRVGVSRIQALRLVDDDLARPSAHSGALRRVLEGAADGEVPLMIFVRSPGTWQIHHGPVHRIVATEGGWLNVMDPGFNLHVREAEIASSWIVRKPTETGWVTSLELYDGAGELLALLFGERKEGEAENPAWQALLD